MRLDLQRRLPRRHPSSARLVVALVTFAVAAALAPLAVAAQAPALTPIDAQNWRWQDDLSWSDYHALPGTDYSDPAIVPTVKKWKVALVVTDFTDKPLALTQPAGGTIFGTPTATLNSIPRAQVPTVLSDLLNTPSMVNHFQTMNRYWMEDTYGKYGVQLDAYGPYTLPGKSWQYFAQDFAPSSGAGTGCVTLTVTPCNRNFRTDSLAAWRAGTGNPTVNTLYDNIFYVSAGEDESSTWQEFGNMQWTQDTVPEAFGPHAYDPTLPNWMRTRYVPWSSWASGETIWPNASGNTSIEGESSGMGTYAHELTHNLGIADNYNNPYDTIVQRSATGPWDMMSRGSFNGPGGPHTRYLIPPTQGGALGSQHNIRNKLKLGFLTNSQVVRLTRSGLAQTGLVVAKVKAREVDPGAELAGITLQLDGTAPVDKGPACTPAANPICSNPTFTGYSMEVVQQLGSDSFDPGHGVLISKTKTAENSSCGRFNCFVWVIDAHPENIDRVDFVDGQGVTQKITIGDYRQLDDATFNAGTYSGTQYEFEDTPNRLHFYVIDKQADANGVLQYTVAVRSLDGAGPQTRGAAVADAPAEAVSGLYTTCNFNLTNTGTAAAINPAAHPQDVTGWVGGDVYRLSVAASGTGWNAQLWNELATAKFGESTTVPVYVTRSEGAAFGTVTLNAVSESDPSKTATGTCSVAVPAAQQLVELSDTLAGLGLEDPLAKDLQHKLDEAAAKLDKPKEACNKLDEFLHRVIEEAAKRHAKLSVADAQALLRANNVEIAIGCFDASSPAPGAEADLVGLFGTIDGLEGVGDGYAQELTNKAREAAVKLVEGKSREACKQLAELAKKIDDGIGKKDKLTAEQGEQLAAEVAAIASELGC